MNKGLYISSGAPQREARTASMLSGGLSDKDKQN